MLAAASFAVTGGVIGKYMRVSAVIFVSIVILFSQLLFSAFYNEFLWYRLVVVFAQLSSLQGGYLISSAIFSGDVSRK